MPDKRMPADIRAAEIGNYNHYSMTSAETATAYLLAGSLLFTIGFLFYKNVAICIGISLCALYYPQLRRKQLVRRRKEELRRQFKHALYSLSSALSAGRSVENSFREAANDLRLLYPDNLTDMIRELERLNRRTENGEPIEKSLLDFGRRSGLEDVLQFADAFAACKRTGGDLVEVMRRTTNLIGEKMEIEQDISVMVAQKCFEARALGFIPFIIVAFLAFSSPDYMEPLYGGLGHLVMSVSLVLLGASQWLAHKIMDIGA
jgi:tight adherence protein B